MGLGVLENKVFVDIDDVLFNTSQHWVELLNKRYDKTVDYYSMRGWDMKIHYPDLSSSAIYDPLLEKEFWDDIQPIPGAYEGLKKLNSAYDVYICSSSYYKSLQYKIPALEKIYPFIEWNKLIICHNKQLLSGHAMIDDGIHNLIDGNYKRILFSVPHNYDINEKEYGCYRADSWDEIIKLVDS